ncbi:peptidylprolyl isomerase [Legionella spiritensis]|uniref:Peptidyl-prolyl cis-trans isomerase n=1 Tax=Legionella spiritensis TaxID=452 RepID=A0A0W0Z5E6_LEGSP|nr:peptidylprolyl isomerase [Legionella spiritensis]KTD64356.1 peptidyl-prolyl cis-trans isomerase B [Legionella spiritensis]SNV46354.1 peptidyl-prolyl cis-trans isomerase B (cyclophilin B) [Legionella spiritensis]VEG91079.1 peptidyl-prolyl cis-trans isomerase B (cyclophilin B) [Legionella spiritensis]
MIVITTSRGDIHVQLDTENTPATSENFLDYVRSGFYNGTIFHRVIDKFMIQGGGLTSDLDQKKTNAPVQNEAKSAKPNKRGTIAMARTMDPHSATAQFFINVADNAFLNFTGEHPQGYGYCVFGEVVEGMDVVDAIVKVKTGERMGHADVPLEDIIIHEIRETDE